MSSLGKRSWVRQFFAGALVLGLAISGAGQTSRVAGAVQGDVVDETGSAVIGATVTLRNQETNQTRTLLTNAEGFFHVGELPVGQYELRVESSGFSPYVNAAIVVSIGRVVHAAVRLCEPPTRSGLRSLSLVSSTSVALTTEMIRGEKTTTS
jgi:hypothetical protein